MHRMFLCGKCCEEKEIGWWDAQWLGITSLVERVRTGLLRRGYVSPDLTDGVEPPTPRDEERAFLAEGTVSTRTIKWAQAVRGQGTEDSCGEGAVGQRKKGCEMKLESFWGPNHSRLWGSRWRLECHSQNKRSHWGVLRGKKYDLLSQFVSVKNHSS